MKIYISGSISDDPSYMKHFGDAEQRLQHDHLVINPARNQGHSYKEYIDIGLFELMQCDAIYMLKGHEKSKGAMLEKHYAEAVGMTILYEK